MKLTIGIPLYNVEKYFHRTMKSVLNQSYKDYEILLVDDGSVDNTGKICDEYAKEYPFVRVIHQSNHGLAYSRNVINKEAKGEYVSSIDGDDIIHPDYYKRMVGVLEDSGLPVVKCQREYLDKGEKPTFKPIGEGYEVITTKEAFENDLLMLKRAKLVEGMCTKLWRRDVLQNVKFNDTLRNEEDTLFVAEMLFEFDKFALISDILYFVVSNETSITCNPKNCERNLLSAIESKKCLIEFIKERDSKALGLIVNNSLFHIFEEYAYWRGKGATIPASVSEIIINTFAPYENMLNFMIKKQYMAFKTGKDKTISFYHKKTLRSIYKRFMRYETYRSKH